MGDSVSTNKLLRQARYSLYLLKATRGRDRINMGGYLVRNFLNKTLKTPIKEEELNFTLSGLRISVQAFSSELGAYIDIFHKGIYEKLPGFKARPGQTIVDAGANVGFFSLRHAKAVGPTGRIYAFEPNHRVFAMLSKNIEQNGFRHVEVYQKALCSEIGEYLLRATSRGTSCGHVVSLDSDDRGQGARTEGTTLDVFVEENDIERIDILKMDTEGSEPDIVKGGLQRALPVTQRVVMESHNTRYPVRDLLKPLGFKMVLDDRSTHVVYFERE